MKEKTKKLIKGIDWKEMIIQILIWSIVILFIAGFIWFLSPSYPGSGSSNQEDCIPNYMGGCDL